MNKPTRRDLVVPCSGKGHKVRLKGGLRFFASARCPTCRSPVDPWRARRLLRCVTNLRRPASTDGIARTLWVLSLATLGLCALGAIVFRRTADVWWLSTGLLFGPRWVLLLPVAVLAIAAYRWDRALLLPLGAAAWILLGPVMGFRTGWRTLLTFGDADRDITVATFNARMGDVLTSTPLELMEEWGAHVAAFQECGPRMRDEIEQLDDLGMYDAWTGQRQCLLSVFPILATEVAEAEGIQSAGGAGFIVRHRLQGPERDFWLTNVHLQTPRDGLSLILQGRVQQGIEVLQRDSFLREIEHRRANGVAAAPGPHVVVGDFNTPAESRIYHEFWDEWTNAFSVAGFGIGGTRLNGWIRSRIDHVLVSGEWRVVDAWMGRHVGSDHRPMVATIRLR